MVATSAFIRSTALVVHDTIPVRWGTPKWLRPAKHLYWAFSIHTASRVLVYSDATARNLWTDLRVGPRRIARFDLGIEPRLVSMVREQRAEAVRPDRLLYVGLHEQHKNLARAMDGFRQSKFASDGATFTLVGAAADTIEDLRRLASRPGNGTIEVLDRCSDEELAHLYAEATLTIQPSLEEGLGLTVIEALAAEIPTCCTAGGALAEASCGAAITFDARSAASIAIGIDTAVSMIGTGEWPARFERFELERVRPTKREMAEHFVAILRRDDLTRPTRRREPASVS
jgi:glycosyltransferase involved in cell wall biosynthesis